MITHKMPKAKIFHIVKFVVSGGISALVLFALLVLFHRELSLNVVLSSVLAYGLSIVVGFVLQKYWTFDERGTRGAHKQLSYYFVIGIINTGLNGLLMYIFVDLLHFWYILAQLISAGLIAAWSYFLYRRFVFTGETNTSISTDNLLAE